MTARVVTTFFAALLLAAGVAAQSPAPAAGAAAPAGQAAPSTGQPADLESPGYTYDPQGRRDPFVSLLRRGYDADRGKNLARAAGVGGLEAGDVTLKGTMQSRAGYVALLEAVDKKTYIVKAGDRLLDGVVKSITADAMVILQQVNDPLSYEKQREVRKMLRQTDEVK